MSHTIDIHCHPTIKVWLFDKTLRDTAKPPDDTELFDISNIDNVYVTIPRMEKGNVSMVWASYYLPESNLLNLAKVAPFIKSIVINAFKKQVSRLENTAFPETPFEQTKQMINKFEQEVLRNGGSCPRSKAEMHDALNSNKKVFLQSMEGSHHLGRGYKKSNGQPDIEKYINNLECLFERGICSITLAHFFPNDLVSVVNGLPPNVISLLNFPTVFPDDGLTEVGEEAVRWMLEQGIIIDLIHSSPKARLQVIEINKQNQYKRPMVFSHCGTAEVFKAHAEQKHYNDYKLNPSNEEILAIKECNGIIGLIFDLYWLRGKEEANAILGLIPDAKGIPYIIETVRQIHNVTGSYDNIAIGTDFDGFTDVIDDAPDISYLPNFRDALVKEGIQVSDIDKIMGLNALRVIEDGWGKVE